ncbi:MAG: hypothetical protein ACOCUO_02520 [archaeon]
MGTLRTSPGPAADHAFRLGIVAAAIVGLGGLGTLYWSRTISVWVAGYTLIILFPLYLVLVAVVLSVWLGYDKDATALRPVYRARNSDQNGDER